MKRKRVFFLLFNFSYANLLSPVLQKLWFLHCWPRRNSHLCSQRLGSYNTQPWIIRMLAKGRFTNYSSNQNRHFRFHSIACISLSKEICKTDMLFEIIDIALLFKIILMGKIYKSGQCSPVSTILLGSWNVMCISKRNLLVCMALLGWYQCK